MAKRLEKGSVRHRIRIKERVRSDRGDSPKRIEPYRVACVLGACALIGILLGLFLGKMIDRAWRIHRVPAQISGGKSSPSAIPSSSPEGGRSERPVISPRSAGSVGR